MLSFGILLLWAMQFGHSSGDDVAGPLLVTPLLEAGKIQEAQNASQVHLQDYPNLISYSGFFTVDKEYNSNIFYWFFPAANGNKSAPVVLWLQGGPGGSLFYGLFVENGPFSVSPDLRLEPRKSSWANSHSVLYLDSPLGTGFSFTEKEGYSTNENQVGNNLYIALVQFFTMFPNLQANDFFVTGESYGGKFVPAACYAIHEKNPTASLKINLRGLAIGNAWTEPESLMKYGDYLYQIGLLDEMGRDKFTQKESEIIEYIRQQEWINAFNLFVDLINGYQVTSTIFKNLTGFSFYYNFLYMEDYTAQQIIDIQEFLSTAAVRKTLHAGSSNSTFQVLNPDIAKYLMDDIMQSVKPWLEELVEYYRVLMYYGQLDISVLYPASEAFLNTLRWSGAEAFSKATRNIWYVGKDLAGYSKTAKNLTCILVRNAGHLVPTDQPEWALDMISKFFNNKPL